MKAFFALLFIILLTSLRLSAQTYEWLEPKLTSADTIVLASHEDFGAIVAKAGNAVPVLKWVASGHPNYKAFLPSQ